MPETTVRAHPRRGTRGVREHFRFIEKGNYGVVSAERESMTTEEKAQHDRELLNDLRRSGYDPIEAHGVYRYENGRKVHERSYLVPKLREEDALALGRKYGQESVLLNNRLLRSRDGTEMMHFNPEHTLFDDEATRQDFSTSITDPRTSKRMVFSLQE